MLIVIVIILSSIGCISGIGSFIYSKKTEKTIKEYFSKLSDTVEDISIKHNELTEYVNKNIGTSIETQKKFIDMTYQINNLDNAVRVLNQGFVTPTQSYMY